MNREQQVGGTPGKAPPDSEKNPEKPNGKDIGPIGTTARIVVGLWFVGSVIHGQLSVHLAPAAWALGLVGFPALVLAWHWWRIRRNPAPFHDTSPLSFALSVALPVALYLTWWYAPPSPSPATQCSSLSASPWCLQHSAATPDASCWPSPTGSSDDPTRSPVLFSRPSTPLSSEDLAIE